MLCHPSLEAQARTMMLDDAERTGHLDRRFVLEEQLHSLKKAVVDRLNGTFRFDKASKHTLFSHYSDAYAMEVVPCRVSKEASSQEKKTNELLDERIFHYQTHTRYVHQQWDKKFRTVIVLFPLADVFATNVFSLSEDKDDYVFLPISWLRLDHQTGEPASGSFISEIVSVWAVNYTDHSQQPSLFLPCFQMHDEEEGTPLAPPDMGYNDLKLDQEACSMSLLLSFNYRANCRRFTKMGLYGPRISSITLCLDPRQLGDIELKVALRDVNGLRRRVSFIRICMANQDSNFMAALESTVAEAHQLSDNVVKNTRDKEKTYDHGTMCGIGRFVEPRKTREDIKMVHEKRCAGFAKTLPNLQERAAIFAENKFPGLVRSCRWHSSIARLDIPSYFGGAKGFSPHMAMSRNLMNASHFDPRDGAPGMCVYAEKDPGNAKDWNFVYPNILIKYNGRTYNGLTVRLSHGVAMLFDGRVIRHCTSIHELDKTNNSTFGFWFGLSGTSFEFNYKTYVAVKKDSVEP